MGEDLGEGVNSKRSCSPECGHPVYSSQLSAACWQLQNEEGKFYEPVATTATGMVI